MELKIALLPGDGIGPEIVGEAVKVLDRVAAKYGHVFKYEKALVGALSLIHIFLRFNQTKTKKRK